MVVKSTRGTDHEYEKCGERATCTSRLIWVWLIYLWHTFFVMSFKINVSFDFEALIEENLDLFHLYCFGVLF